MSGVIAAGSKATAVAGATILQTGGNAVDAAVAAAFASFIGEIGVVHMGGSGFAQIFNPQQQQSVAYDFFSNTPGLNGTLPDQLDFAKVVVDFGATTQDFYLGRASVAVPGNIVGLCQMAQDHGRLPLATLLQPAIDLARNGFPLEPFQADTCALLAPLYTYSDGIRHIFTRHGRIIQPDQTMILPELADTLAQLAAEGQALVRHGRLAQAILQDQRQNGGLLTQTDLETYQVYTSSPIRLPYRNYELLLPPPSSIGGALTAFSLSLLAQFQPADFSYHSTRHLQLLCEVMAATNRARPWWEQWLEDMGSPQALALFLSPAFIEPFVQEIQTALDGRRPSQLATEADGPNHTSHLSVVDNDGLAVSLTTTAGESAGYVVPGTGYIPNNMMGEEDLHPAGFHSRPPGQRLPTMMTPTIVLQGGQTKLVLGSGGSLRIRSAILQLLNNSLDYAMPLEQAVNQARIHLENGVLQCEFGCSATAVADLADMGYAVNAWPSRSMYFGGAHSVGTDANGRWQGVGDNRRGGAVAYA